MSRRSRRGRGRRRGRKSRKTGRGDRRTGKITEVRIERSPKGTGKPAKVTRVRRRNGEVSEETYDL